MATILNADIQVDYLSDNRQKRLSWLGGTNTNYTMNEIYSAMATLLDETTTIDDGTCFSAETPVEYTIGKIDTGDTEPWYITYDLMEKVTGGALRSSGWTRVTASNTGIICVPVISATSDIDSTDEGDTISGATTGSGTLLEYIVTGGTNDYAFIRPDDDTAPSDFTTADQQLDMLSSAHFGDQWSTAASTTGEQIWANLYSIGTIDPNVHLYQYQGAVATDGDRVRVFSWNDNTQDWYGNGHIDTVVALKDIEVAVWDIIDGGFLTVFARKYGDLYASFEVATSITSGGRNPIPVQTAADLDNTTGLKRVTLSGDSGTFDVGDRITGDVSLAEIILTDVASFPTVDYIIIGDPQTDLNGSEAVTNETQTGAATGSGATSIQGPALSTWFTSNTTPTIAFTHALDDIDDDSIDENYAVTINCQANPLTEVYEWQKYATRNGEITNDLDNINGESYLGGEVYIGFSAETTLIPEGDDVVQQTTGATGVVMAYDTTNLIMLLRDTRGTFEVGTGGSHTITSNDSSGEVEVDSGAGVEVATFAPKTASPLGTFAGGTAFAARGVLYTNYLAADANSFILTPIEGGTKERPASLTILVSNLDGGTADDPLNDRVSVFRLTGAGADIDKLEHDAVGGEAIGANTITVSVAIPSDVPGKSTGGTLVLIDDSDNGAEYKLRYSSWSGAVFTLNEITGTSTGGSTTTLEDSGATFTDGADQVFRGDLITVLGTESAHVLTVDSDTVLTIEGTWTAPVTDAYEINTSPILIDTADKIYVPFIDRVATGAEESVSVTFLAQIFYRAKVRNTRAAIKIKPFSVDGTTTGADVSVATIRQEDTIIT